MTERPRVAVVTGSAAGIGLATVERLVEDGYTTVITDVNVEAGAAQAQRLTAAGGRVEFRRMDVTSETDVDSMVPAIAADLGGIDLFVNNAGIQAHGGIEGLAFRDWRRVLDVDLDGVFLGLRAAGRVMLGQGRDDREHRIGLLGAGAPGRAPYVVSKAGVVALTKVAAVEWSARGVRVNAVAPGYIDTALLRSAYERGAIAEEVVYIPMGRVAEAREIAEVIVFLASPAAGYITGQTLNVDGGFLVDYGVGMKRRT